MSGPGVSPVPFLREILAELASAPDAALEVEAARTLLRYYLKRVRAVESLTGEASTLREPGRPKRKPMKRTRPIKQQRSRNLILSILRDVPGQAMNTTQIRKRLAEEGVTLGRQAVSYHLKVLSRRGDVEVLDGLRAKWRSVVQGRTTGGN